MTRYTRQLITALVTLGLGAACGGDDDGSSNANADADTAVADIAVDAAGDTGRPPPDTSPRLLREPCETNEQCASGWCVPTADGPVCTDGCDDGCPAGWECGLVLNRSTDFVAVCLDRSVSLCHPCVDDDDCNRFTPGAGHRCLDRGDGGGSFCGIACAFDASQCPPGFTCTAIDGLPGDEGGQCTPQDGAECGCNALATELALVTTCSVTNDIGTCEGLRGCAAGGLSSCDARSATVEVCNGVDDDCDGQVDKGMLAGAVACEVVNEHGTCPGIEYCVGGVAECVGAPALAEICDGQDQNCDGVADEGYPDFDGDGQADCVDDDDDDDGTPDDRDCAPTDPAIADGATEVCHNGVDDDCDGATDEENAEGCDPYYRDVDGDGYGSAIEPPRCLCAPDPASLYVVDRAGDCDDLAAGTHPSGVELCNGTDDDCDDAIDEGVQAPCGGCVNLCVIDTGPGTARAFAPAPGNSQAVQLDADGHLVLASGANSGIYHHIIEGWPTSKTRWTVFFVDAETPGDGTTNVSLRYRVAASAAALETAPWQPPLGPFPPNNFPATFDITGDVLEVQIGLGTSEAGTSPVVRSLSVLAESVP